MSVHTFTRVYTRKCKYTQSTRLYIHSQKRTFTLIRGFREQPTPIHRHKIGINKSKQPIKTIFTIKRTT